MCLLQLQVRLHYITLQNIDDRVLLGAMMSVLSSEGVLDIWVDMQEYRSSHSASSSLST